MQTAGKSVQFSCIKLGSPENTAAQMACSSFGWLDQNIEPNEGLSGISMAFVKVKHRRLGDGTHN
uniref:Uncharacterized protein n=1 Tax=Romanomermis culicivorax TaxID=13658 RepID=A0A915JW79_ROMCU